MTADKGNIFEAARPRFFSIASDRPFLRAFAQTLRASITAKKDVALPDVVIFLPTRRAVRALSDAFVETSPGGQASLLPRVRALGDVDEDELIAFDGAAEDEIDLPPAISLSQRRLALAKLVAEKDKPFFDGQRRWAGAIAAADELGKLLDSLYTEEIDAAGLQSIVPETLAAHWRHSLEFLSIITERWPAYLRECGLMDPADRRVKLIDRQEARWRRDPPQTPVIVAGTTGSTPAVARMMKTVADLPMGCVLLPGLDLQSPARIWDAVDEPHPQNGLKQLLTALGISREAILEWPGGDVRNQKTEDRAALIAVALRPAGASEEWRDWTAAAHKRGADLQAALSGVELVEAPDEDREAAAIALKMRATLEEKHKRAMLVTPDRDLARRVSLKMRRWGVAVDDSAGVPFANSACGAFLRLSAEWLADIADPARLMSVLDHPLFGGGLGDAERRRAVAQFDAALRGLRPGPGIAGLTEKIMAKRNRRPETEALLQTLADNAAYWRDAPQTFAGRFNTHIAIAENLAATAREDGATRLWRGEDGEAGAGLLAQLQDGLGHIVHDLPEDYPEIFTRLIANAVVRRRAPAHPRLFILGPLEARLQTADIVILGGLNEGVWPRDAAIDPFLSRPMRMALGLPSPEQRIGLAAHDFAQLSAAPAVMLTRAVRADGKPAKPSRWIIRLKNILAGANALAPIYRSQDYDALAARLDALGEMIKIGAPKPTPPIDARPTDFFVTQIEKLLRDPYGIYAKRILRLRKMEALNEPFDNRHAGNLFHQIFHDYAAAPAPPTHAERIRALDALFEKHAFAFGLSNDHKAFWRQPARDAFDWLARWDDNRRKAGTPVILEGQGVWAFAVGARRFTLNARADRIDKLHDGAAFIIDYKTGTPPTLRQTKTISPQLPLTGVIVKEGGYEELGAAPVSGFEYVRALRRSASGANDTTVAGADAEALIDQAEERLRNLLAQYDDPDTAYLSQPRPQFVDDFGDYDHLARRRERNAMGGEE